MRQEDHGVRGLLKQFGPESALRILQRGEVSFGSRFESHLVYIARKLSQLSRDLAGARTNADSNQQKIAVEGTVVAIFSLLRKVTAPKPHCVLVEVLFEMDPCQT